MSLLIMGLFVFLGIHLVPSFPGFRNRLVDRLGEMSYKGFFSLVSLAGFVAIIMGKAEAEFVSVWVPPAQLAIATKILMLPALILLVAAYIPSNIKRKVKHPMLAGIKFWALGHLLINGDLASILLFGGFLVFAVVAMISSNKRMVDAELLPVQPIYKDIVVVVVGVIAYGAIAMHHMQLFGVPIF